jgi:hypothetical protein
MFGMLYRTPCDNVDKQNFKFMTAVLENSNNKQFYYNSVQFFGNRGSSVRRATPYGLDGPGIKCR